MRSIYSLKKGLRGGISYITKRHAKANNKKSSTFITYLYMNYLYGWEMNEYLPYGGFKWLENIDEFDINSINEKN